MERQNRDLLKSMNDRTRLQLRLQATVEGLSVAAISYYVVGLFGYLVKGLSEEGVPVDITLATALFVPVAVASNLVRAPAHPPQAYRCRGLTAPPARSPPDG